MKDYRSKPISRMVSLGESTTWGYSASDKRCCWVNILHNYLERFQGSKIDLINRGIGSNVLSTACPAYAISERPCGMERLDEHVINEKPDLVTISYGLNDSRGGTDIRVFRAEYQSMIDRIRAAGDTLIVLVGMYAMHEANYYTCEGWDRSDPNIAVLFNEAIRQLARDNDLLFADIYEAQRDTVWLVDPDHCHPNDLGHLLIANRVFEVIARNCSFTSLTMPTEPSLDAFVEKYGNGPD